MGVSVRWAAAPQLEELDAHEVGDEALVNLSNNHSGKGSTPASRRAIAR